MRMNTTNNFDLSIADLILLLLDIAAIILHDYDLPPKNFESTSPCSWPRVVKMAL